jgi:hypothetical protein
VWIQSAHFLILPDYHGCAPLFGAFDYRDRSSPKGDVGQLCHPSITLVFHRPAPEPSAEYVDRAFSASPL